jgi:hypothetical protein
MKRSIATELGLMMARFEHELYRHQEDVGIETYQKIALISETCRNFAQAGDMDFAAAFDKAYQEEIVELETTPAPHEVAREYREANERESAGLTPLEP